MTFDTVIFPPTMAAFPDIEVEQVKEHTKTLICTRIRGENFVDSDLYFWIVFSSEVTNYHVLTGEWDLTGMSFINPEKPN